MYWPAGAHQIPVLAFPKGQRKDELAKAALARFPGTEGVLFVGKARKDAGDTDREAVE